MPTKEKTFQIGKRGAKKVSVPKPHKIEKAKAETNDLPELKPIQGMWPQSKEEFWVALALWKLHIDFEYQYQLFGGRTVQGGQVIDFWVYTVPLPTPVFVQGTYWHYGTAQRTYISEMNIMFLKQRLAGQIAEPVLVNTDDLPTPDLVYQFIKRELHMMG